MSVYERASSVDGHGEIRIGRSDQRVAVTLVTMEGHAKIVLSLQDAQRMGEALIELAKENGV